MKKSDAEDTTSTKRRGRVSRKATRSQADQVAEPGTSQTKQQLQFEVWGKPIGQPRHRASTIGGRARMYLPKSHKVHGFKAAIRAAFIENAGKWRTIKGPVRLKIWCWFEMPKSWPKKDRAKFDKEWHTGTPDWDNVGKAVSDALTDCGAWVDDSQVVICSVVKKWCDKDPLTMITIEECEPCRDL